ncbi:hypothetical protein [Spirosoma linguale]|uniref:Coenzyme Q-binding protein COQ10 START domain-containing protein n=1 Tax=Spirosoma linguale (strain ATCC 33905 / DSM 74 / LMG 10896 / Claus 1) TaxID=504472 RepID=D2QHM3_SPILD|nr:conserved hypothetical protein [Spirosoma linguale DSM 74]
MSQFFYQCTVGLPVDTIDLYQWLTSLSEADYQRFSSGHRAIGLCRTEDGEGMINVESIGGNLLVQHYTIVQKDRTALKLVSPRTDAYLFHLLKMKVGVEWRMSIRYRDEESCLFTCEIGVSYPNELLAMASRFVAGPYFISRHLNEEAPRFAQDIERKFRNW